MEYRIKIEKYQGHNLIFYIPQAKINDEWKNLEKVVNEHLSYCKFSTRDGALAVIDDNYKKYPVIEYEYITK